MDTASDGSIPNCAHWGTIQCKMHKYLYDPPKHKVQYLFI